MTFLDERDFSDVPLIPEYFRGKTVFITGGSGFIGKALVEKLLYSCTELDRIYLLLRSKKGVEPKDRLRILYENVCFDRLRSEKPDVFMSKVFIISGDVTEPNLGMSEDDRALLVNRTNIIFHSAATVRFDEPLKQAIRMNLIGTKQMIDLAKDMLNFECFIHVSTSFSNEHREPLREVLYPPVADWRNMIEICKMDDHTLQVLTPKLMGDMTNTYVLTKHLAEHMIYEERGKLPIVITKPSIVLASLKEPIPGWIDNFNGPIGLAVATGCGIVKVMYGAQKVKSDYVPVDLVVRALITAAWLRGTKKIESDDDIPIYNICGSGHFNLYLKDLKNNAMEASADVPFDSTIWKPGCSSTSSSFIFHLYVYFLQLIPFSLLDLLLRLFSKKPRLVTICRRVYVANMVLKNFIFNEWTFIADNLNKLRSVIKNEDKDEFDYTIENINLKEYFRNGCKGAKVFLLKEKMENLPYAKAHVKRLTILDTIVKVLVVGVILWYFFSTNMAKSYLTMIGNYF